MKEELKEYGLCKCGNPGTEWHTCPYDEELDLRNEDGEFELCNCCEDCAQECSDEV